MALKYYASQRIDVRKGKQIDGVKDGPAKGLHIKAKVVKNKTGIPYGSVTFDILFDRGIDAFGCVLDAAVKVLFLEILSSDVLPLRFLGLPYPNDA